MYGIPQSGRRLQRKVFPWMIDVAGLRRLDDSDGCVFVYDYLRLARRLRDLRDRHLCRQPADRPLGGSRRRRQRGVDKDSYYHKFVTALRKDWDVIDEGPMVDLLSIEARYNDDGTITLHHQESYVKKLVAKYFPDGVPSKLKSVSTPYSERIEEHVAGATSSASNTTANPEYPALIKPMQERLGALLYLARSTRADVGYAVPYLCRAMSRPTPELLAETDQVLAYLARYPSIGLTYSRSRGELLGHSDASWAVKHSTSGWVITWQGCAIEWGSRKQDCVALSSCESEIIALSEAAKYMVYFRKLLSGLDSSHVPSAPELRTDNMGARDLCYITRSTTTRPSTSSGATSSYATWWRRCNSSCRTSTR